jgi:hypothetical protein
LLPASEILQNCNWTLFTDAQHPCRHFLFQFSDCVMIAFVSCIYQEISWEIIALETILAWTIHNRAVQDNILPSTFPTYHSQHHLCSVWLNPVMLGARKILLNWHSFLGEREEIILGGYVISSHNIAERNGSTSWHSKIRTPCIFLGATVFPFLALRDCSLTYTCIFFGVLLDGPSKILTSPKCHPFRLYRPHEGFGKTWVDFQQTAQPYVPDDKTEIFAKIIVFQTNSVALVRERTIPTVRPPPQRIPTAVFSIFQTGTAPFSSK